MKNTLFLFIAALFFSASVNAQSTVDSIAAKYHLLPMPEALTIEKTFPVLGTYQLNAEDATAQDVVITLDQENKGIVWIEGLPEGKMKAYLKKSPATYRIVAQKTESGKRIPEGTLIFDPSTSSLNIALGKAFDNVDPASVFNAAGSASADVAASGASQVKVKTKSGVSKSKTKLMLYTALKTEQNGAGTTGVSAPVNPNTPQ
jgi:hypothetical protein